MNSLTSKDWDEINIAIYQYLKAQNYPSSAEMFQTEAELESKETTKANNILE